MAEGVRKTFRKHLKTLTEFYIEVEGKEPGTEALKKIEEKAYAMTRKDTHQAMEGFIHNLNTMHSRGEIKSYSVPSIMEQTLLPKAAWS
mgnify:FL=1